MRSDHLLSTQRWRLMLQITFCRRHLYRLDLVTNEPSYQARSVPLFFVMMLSMMLHINDCNKTEIDSSSIKAKLGYLRACAHVSRLSVSRSRDLYIETRGAGKHALKVLTKGMLRKIYILLVKYIPCLCVAVAFWLSFFLTQFLDVSRSAISR